MTIRNNNRLVQAGTKQHAIVVALLLAGLSGCSTSSAPPESILGKEVTAYQSRKAEKARSLEVPPDLTQLERDNRYALPDPGVATASDYLQQNGRGQPVADTTVAVNASQDMRIERDGSQRWLVVRKSPEELWPEIKRFWEESGFSIQAEMPEAGILETGWAENRAKIPDDFIRRTIGKVIDRLYSTGERDKFRTRIERGPDGRSEIFITHRGLEEAVVGSQKDEIKWVSRPSDPDLEAEFLARLMVFLGAGKDEAKAAVTGAENPPDKARLVKNAGQMYVEVDEGFERAWRKVGLVLDRAGFTVEDRNRADGLYFVRYVDKEQDADAGKGFFSRLFSSESDQKSAQRYRIRVSGSDAGSRIIVLSHDGRSDSSPTADRILTLLQEQLK